MTWKLFLITNNAIYIDDVVYDCLNRILPLSVFGEVVKFLYPICSIGERFRDPDGKCMADKKCKR